MSVDPYLSRKEPGPETRNRETATTITTKADRLLKALRSLHPLDRYAIMRTVVDASSEEGRARRALLRLEADIRIGFRQATGIEEPCERCDGRGIVTGPAVRAVPCPDCDGAGVR